MKRWMVQQGVKFPIILKPDVGERGFLVEKIDDESALRTYLEKAQFDVIAQSFVDLPTEISVFYHRLPGSASGRITSLCLKETLQVMGDGSQNIGQLMLDEPRASLQHERLKATQPEVVNQIPAMGEVVLLEPIGNHSRGTKFLNGNAQIDQALTDIFDALWDETQGIFYGRFDLKCNSLRNVKEGGAIMVFEFNGVASEPAHVYDPTYPVWQAYRDFYTHWRIMFEIYKVQQNRGVHSLTIIEAIVKIRDHFRYLKTAKIPWAS